MGWIAQWGRAIAHYRARRADCYGFQLSSVAFDHEPCCIRQHNPVIAKMLCASTGSRCCSLGFLFLNCTAKSGRLSPNNIMIYCF